LSWSRLLMKGRSPSDVIGSAPGQCHVDVPVAVVATAVILRTIIALSANRFQAKLCTQVV